MPRGVPRSSRWSRRTRYGHGAVPVARAAIEGGASRLGLAALAEVEELRAAGVDAPLVLWGPLLGDEWRRAAATGCEIAVWTPEGAAAAAEAGIGGSTSSSIAGWGVSAPARTPSRRLLRPLPTRGSTSSGS